MTAPMADPADLPNSVFFKLVRVVNLTARPFQQRVGRQHQLTLNEWRAMAVLGARPGLTATQVADLTGLDKMAVSRALGGLQRHKRLHRHEDPTDLRRTRLYLSSIGKTLFATVSAQAREREAELFAGVAPDELDQLDAILDKLIESVTGNAAPSA
ncbi:MarR family winged helix-turn-helix transcriptional regulator [Variovorax sp. Sphag1AA]|uniref:MarR family winged helix-turn-helix transcriptional regulator n=1 Tax=Variovorax sp. Sphag1AA TaxID=2587027 RepID=UPI001845AA28|nr:MarR family winged helix-turn-helix transcriptional regulator [Variovorax sp. Sphag1AA]MBB3179973.1 DNA-binding MarR family transcriptional regulator [Variovorax sp. Sphag1AA]